MMIRFQLLNNGEQEIVHYCSKKIPLVCKNQRDFFAQWKPLEGFCFALNPDALGLFLKETYDMMKDNPNMRTILDQIEGMLNESLPAMINNLKRKQEVISDNKFSGSVQQMFMGC